MPEQAVEILDDGLALAINHSNGQRARYHAIWLRDNMLDAKSISEQNGQRLISVLDLPDVSRISCAKITTDDQLSLEFSDHRCANYPLTWLRQYTYDSTPPDAIAWTFPEQERWDQNLSAKIPTVDFTEAKNNKQALAQWLGGIQRYGFAVMTGMPCESGTLCEAGELFGFIRETNYGRFFEVRSEINPVNLAYTGLGLQAHSDNPYRDPVPTLQLLACLENTTDGGDSIVVDAFKAVELLAEESPESLRLLSQYCARFQYAGGEGVSLKSRRPMIELAPDGELIAVRFNNRSVAPIVDVPFDQMSAYYAAYQRFAKIITRSSMEVAFKLKPGEMFIVQNTRVLHSRKAFSEAGTRWLQGCYVDMDGLLSTLRMLQQELAV